MPYTLPLTWSHGLLKRTKLVEVIVLILIALPCHLEAPCVSHVALHCMQGCELLRVWIITAYIQRDMPMLKLCTLVNHTYKCKLQSDCVIHVCQWQLEHYSF